MTTDTATHSFTTRVIRQKKERKKRLGRTRSPALSPEPERTKQITDFRVNNADQMNIYEQNAKYRQNNSDLNTAMYVSHRIHEKIQRPKNILLTELRYRTREE